MTAASRPIATARLRRRAGLDRVDRPHRRHDRYGFHALVAYGDPETVLGFTEDISGQGCFVAFEGPPPPVGAELELLLRFESGGEWRRIWCRIQRRRLYRAPGDPGGIGVRFLNMVPAARRELRQLLWQRRFPEQKACEMGQSA